MITVRFRFPVISAPFPSPSYSFFFFFVLTFSIYPSIFICLSTLGDYAVNVEGMRERNATIEELHKINSEMMQLAKVEGQNMIEEKKKKTEAEIAAIQREMRMASLQAEEVEVIEGEDKEEDIDEEELARITGEAVTTSSSINKNLSEAVLKAEEGHGEEGDYEDSYGSDDFADFEGGEDEEEGEEDGDDGSGCVDV